MVINQDTKQLIKGIGIKLIFGILGFTAAFAVDYVGQFHLNPVVAALVVASLHDIAQWADSRVTGGRAAKALARATFRR